MTSAKAIEILGLLEKLRVELRIEETYGPKDGFGVKCQVRDLANDLNRPISITQQLIQQCVFSEQPPTTPD